MGKIIAIALCLTLIVLSIYSSYERTEDCERKGGRMVCDSAFGSDYKGRGVVTTTCNCYAPDGRRIFQ